MSGRVNFIISSPTTKGGGDMQELVNDKDDFRS